jgi:hypothetical protein
VYSFYVVGNQLYDSSNQPALLRGFARPSLEWSPTGEQLSLEDYQLMKSWNSNVIRLSLNQCFWLSGLKDYNSAYKDTVNAQVTQIKSLGMAVILDLHWSNKGSTTTTCSQQRMADSYSINFWQEVIPKQFPVTQNRSQ